MGEVTPSLGPRIWASLYLFLGFKLHKNLFYRTNWHVNSAESLKHGITKAIETATFEMFKRYWAQMEYRLDIQRPTRDLHMGIC
jgi:hypothetical protein